MELILVRHGRPERVDHDPCGADPGLTDLGHRQAAASADFLQNAGIEHVYVSPMLRAIETAKPLSTHVGQDEATVVDGIAEFDLGETSYIPGEELELTQEGVDALYAKMMAPEFAERVIDGMDHIIRNNPGGRVAAVCHGGVISRYLCHILGLDPATTYLNSEYTAVTRLEASSSGRRSMLTFNEHHWLHSL